MKFPLTGRIYVIYSCNILITQIILRIPLSTFFFFFNTCKINCFELFCNQNKISVEKSLIQKFKFKNCAIYPSPKKGNKLKYFMIFFRISSLKCFFYERELILITSPFPIKILLLVFRWCYIYPKVRNYLCR